MLPARQSRGHTGSLVLRLCVSQLRWLRERKTAPERKIPRQAHARMDLSKMSSQKMPPRRARTSAKDLSPVLPARQRRCNTGSLVLGLCISQLRWLWDRKTTPKRKIPRQAHARMDLSKMSHQKMRPVRCHPRKVSGLVCELCVSSLQGWLRAASSQQEPQVPCPKQSRVVL